MSDSIPIHVDSTEGQIIENIVSSVEGELDKLLVSMFADFSNANTNFNYSMTAVTYALLKSAVKLNSFEKTTLIGFDRVEEVFNNMHADHKQQYEKDQKNGK